MPLAPRAPPRALLVAGAEDGRRSSTFSAPGAFSLAALSGLLALSCVLPFARPPRRRFILGKVSRDRHSHSVVVGGGSEAAAGGARFPGFRGGRLHGAEVSSP